MEEQVDTTQATQEEIGSGSISKRGITCGKGARKEMKASKTRLTVEFDFQLRQAICVNASAFVYECGYILRKNYSMQYKEWRHVPREDRIPLRHKLLTLFDIDVEDKNVCEVIDNCMARTWRSYRSDLRV